MVVIAGAVFGALLGVQLARRHGGRRLDMLQYAAGLAIVGAVIGVFATIATHRMLIG